MEANFFIRGRFENIEQFAMAQRMLSDDPPIFVEEVEKGLQPIFIALEDILQPDSYEKIDNNELELFWEVGFDYDDDIKDTLKRLSKSGFSPLVGYYWADEDEGFFTYKNNKLILVDWKKRFKPSMPESSELIDEWVSSCLSVLINE